MRPHLPFSALLPALVTGCLLVAPPAPAQEPGAAAVDDSPTLRAIMGHPHWLGRAPERPYWNWDSRSVLYLRDHPLVDGVDPRTTQLYRQPIGEGPAVLVPPAEYGATDPPDTVRDATGRRLAYERDGDLFVRSLESGAVRQITRTNDRESSPFFLADGRLGYARGRNGIYARDLVTGLEVQLFDVRTELAPDEKREQEREQRDYVAREEERLIDWVAAEDARYRLGRQREEARREDGTRPDEPWFLGDKVDLRGLSASPDGRFALVVLTDKGKPPERGGMPAYVAASGDVELRDVRPKVGQQDERDERLMVLDRETGERHAIDLADLPTRGDDPLAALRRAAKERAEAEKAAKAAETEATGGAAQPPGTQDTAPADDAGDNGRKAGRGDGPRPVSLGRPTWSPDGSHALLQAFSHDNKDRWILLLSRSSDDGATAAEGDPYTLRVLHHQHDPAWINWSFRDAGLVPDSDLVWFLSEASGWSQLYLVDASDPAAEPRRLTEGDFVVDAPEPDPSGTHLYYLSNELHPGRTEVYRVELSTGSIEQVTDLGGLNTFRLSPDGATLVLTHSTRTMPPEVWTQAASPGAEPTRLTDTVSDEFLAIAWTEPQIVEVPSSHQDRPITSRLYVPAGEVPEGGRPAVVFVHGAGYLQNAHYGWSSYFREFMFHTLLNRLGYVVLDMDYRGSKGYGRDWRTAIYRQMGTPEVEDLQDGVRWLAEQHSVDAERVGVYGGSYGGFLTFMAMFREPDLFAAGAALRPVTDWAHYNHPYTSNILNTPDIDPEAYRRSSPIEFAEGLEKPLLIASGMLDDNVFFQDSVRLVQRLIELEKENWELAVYPIEPHGFREPSSWLDEYRRILALFEEHVRSP